MKKCMEMLLFAFRDLYVAISSSLQNYQFHHRRIGSFEHLIMCAFSLYNSDILSTTVSILDLK